MSGRVRTRLFGGVLHPAHRVVTGVCRGIVGYGVAGMSAGIGHGGVSGMRGRVSHRSLSCVRARVRRDLVLCHPVFAVRCRISHRRVFRHRAVVCAGRARASGVPWIVLDGVCRVSSGCMLTVCHPFCRSAVLHPRDRRVTSIGVHAVTHRRVVFLASSVVFVSAP